MTKETTDTRQRGAVWTRSADAQHALRASRNAYLDVRSQFMAASGHRAKVLAADLPIARAAWVMAFLEFVNTQAALDDELTAPRR